MIVTVCSALPACTSEGSAPAALTDASEKEIFPFSSPKSDMTFFLLIMLRGSCVTFFTKTATALPVLA